MPLLEVLEFRLLHIKIAYIAMHEYFLAEDKQTTGTPNPLEPLTEIQLIAHVALSFIKPQDHSLHQEFRFVWYDKNEKYLLMESYIALKLVIIAPLAERHLL